MYNILINSENIDKFKAEGIISLKNLSKCNAISFVEQLSERTALINLVFAEVLKNLTPVAAKIAEERIAKTVLVLPLDAYEKDINDFQTIKENTCIVQIKKDVKAENLFREEEILSLKNNFSRFSQISRTVKYDKNNEICFIKMHAILKLKDKTFIIQMVYIRLGETNFYEYEKNLIFFIHPIYIKYIIVNDRKITANKAFYRYFTKKYDIEKYYSQQEQKACYILRISYNPSNSYLCPLFIAQHSLSIEDFEKEHSELF